MSVSQPLLGKIALVTGAAHGIGRGCALELARRGADLVVNDRPAGDALDQLADEARRMGRACHVIPADVFDPAGATALVADAAAAAGRIDILVSNPAYSRRGPFLEYSLEDFERTLNGTLTSGFVVSQAVARQMVQQGEGGKIIFISSVQAEMPAAHCGPYSAAKAALNQLTRTIAVELCPHRINVNAIEPGWIDTEGERRAFSDEMVDRAGPSLPWGRLGTPRDIGCAAAFLASGDADYITGVILPVDGLFRFKDSCADKVIQPT
ncbi:MAG: SDR family oxidoreductase [Planctomycetales bacterium]|nr:SDR family oxidoreductase [Planctomycetales bacterium]